MYMTHLLSNVQMLQAVNVVIPTLKNKDYEFMSMR